ncbi:MFS transporter [Streptomyces sp. NPDC001255]|uniref:MFS transporter n=1 Tax=Streptomyces sp. NPDC001255 TaxID=3364550 RepID=UPI00369E75E1
MSTGPPNSPALGTSRPPGRRPEWAGRNYSLLTAAAVVSNLGSQGALIASAFAVLGAGGDSGDVGLVAAARTLPLVVFLLVGGALADRLPRHHVMVAANSLNCVSQGLFAVLVLTGHAALWSMMLLAALGGTGTAFFSPASEGMLLASVRGPQASRAFAFYRVAMHGAGIGGAALGGALVAVIGPGWVLAVDAAAFAAAGALRALLDVEKIPRREGDKVSLLRDLREGWQEVIGRSWLWSIVLQFAVVNAVVGAAEAVYGPLVAEEHLGGPGPWGTALAGFGAGTLLGALAMTRWRPARPLLAGTLCVLPLALPSAALAVPLSAVGLFVVMFVSGTCVEVFGVSWMTVLHQEIPEDKFSRVSSYDWLGSIAMLPLATAIAGPVESAVGRSAALWGCSGLILLLTLAVLCVPEVRNLRRAPGAAAVPVLPAPEEGLPETVTTPGGERPGA